MNPTLLVALLLLPSFFVFFLAERSKKKAISQKIPLLPSPRGLPFIGNLLDVGPPAHRSLCKLSKKHGPLMLLHLGCIPTLIVSSAKHAQEFLKTHDLVFASRPSSKVSRTLCYNNIDIGFAPYGECWKQTRKITMIHLLSQKMVRSFSFVRKEEVSQLLEMISQAASKDNGVLCMSEMLNSLINNVLCRAVLGSSLNDESRSLVCKLVEKNSTFISFVFLEDYFPWLRWLDVLLGSSGKLSSHHKIWDVLLEKIIEDHLNQLKEGERKDCTNLIDVLLELQKDPTMEFHLTREHIKAILMDMFNGGTETSFVTLDWSMTELIRNQEVMKKVQEEIRTISNGEDMIREEHLDQMNYLNAVIKEVLRLHPPTPLLLPRESMQDCQIHGYNIPKETRVLINAWAIGRDDATWEDPEEFKPERFLNNTRNYKGNDFHFIPFGAGRRICPGISFAIAIVELTLANLLYRFNWSLPKGISIEDLNMEDSAGIVTRRNQKLELVPTLNY